MSDAICQAWWGDVMVWGCFTAGKMGDLYKVKGMFNKEGYHSILQRHAIPCGQRLIEANFLLQQDNDPKHTSKLCKHYHYLGKKQPAGILSVMEWLAQSPDLNPIELLWEQLDRMVRKKCPLSQSNLWEVLQEAWGEISSDYLNKLTARMPKVCKAVIAAIGELFDESKVWRTKLLFQIKLIISNLVNVLTIFSIHFATHFHGKHEIVWVTPNFWTVVYLPVPDSCEHRHAVTWPDIAAISHTHFFFLRGFVFLNVLQLKVCAQKCICQIFAICQFCSLIEDAPSLYFCFFVSIFQIFFWCPGGFVTHRAE